MSIKTISKKPALVTTTPTDNTYQGLTQSQLLIKVKKLHEQVLKTNKYLMDIHRIAIYNWDENDTGNIMIEIPEDKKGLLLDAIVRLRGNWDPATNALELVATDETKIGWMYKVATASTVEALGTTWKNGDYALYDENGVLHNVQADMLANLFTPITLIESNTIQFEDLPQSSDSIQLRAHVKIDPTDDNDLEVSARGIYSDAYKKARALITIQETAPTEDNLAGGLKIVYLAEPPEVFFNGYLYLIPPPTTVVEN
jgi:hypothetical protein